MKHCTHTFKRDPYTGFPAFGYRGTKRNKPRFNIIPINLSTFRLLKYSSEGTVLLLIHAEIVSYNDTMSSNEK